MSHKKGNTHHHDTDQHHNHDHDKHHHHHHDHEHGHEHDHGHEREHEHEHTNNNNQQLEQHHHHDHDGPCNHDHFDPLLDLTTRFANTRISNSIRIKELNAKVGAKTSDGKEIEYSSYIGEEQISELMALIDKDLSEPYSIFTYRYFINNWPQLCIMVCTQYTTHKQTSKKNLTEI